MDLILVGLVVALVAVAMSRSGPPGAAPSALPPGVAVGGDGVYAFRGMPLWWKRLEDPDMVNVVMSLADLTDPAHELFVRDSVVGWIRVLKRPGAPPDPAWEGQRP